MATTNGNGGTKNSRKRLIGVGVVLIVSLLIAGLFLPPISLGERLFGDDGEQELEAEAPEATTAEGITLLVPGGEAVNAVAVSLDVAAADERAAEMASAVPAGTTLVSDIYLLEPAAGDLVEGAVTVSVPDSAGGVQALDLLGWEGSAWRFLPAATSNGSTLTSAPRPLPEAVALARVAPPEEPVIGAELLPAQEPPDALPELGEVTVGALTLQPDGTLEGEVVAAPEGDFRQFVRATNTGIFIDQEAIASLLADEAARGAHLEALVAAAEPYDGLNLDYQGVAIGQKATFTTFAGDLSAALEEAGKGLIVTLDAPAVAGNGGADTGGQDWTALAALADAIYMRMPLNPAAYGPGEQAEQLVAWAVRQVPRQKLTLVYSANAVDVIGGSFQELPNTLALDQFGDLTLSAGEETVEPGTPVEVSLTGDASPLEWDGESIMYKYSYEQAGQTHTVWLNNEAAVSQRLQLAAPFAVRGIVLSGLGEAGNSGRFAAVLEQFRAGETIAEPPGATFLWTVEADEDNIIASDSGETLSYRWEGTDEPGLYTIRATFTQGDTQATLGTVEVTVEEEEVVEAEPTPTAEGTPQATATPGGPTATPAPQPTAVALDPGDADAIVSMPANFRSGPSVAFGAMRVLEQGTRLQVIGRNAASDWLQVRPVATPDEEGWVFASLLSVNSSVAVSGLPVVEVAAPAPVANVAPPVVANSGFELGGQAFGAPYGQMSYAGMNWIKRQHKWSPGNTGQEVAGMIAEAHNAGFRILLSMPGQVRPSSIDFGAYVEFLRAVASLPDPPDAIEVWNEQNIDAEWPVGQISPQAYVQNMLAPAYQAIKGANSRIMVISGAPAPTGFFGGCGSGGCDDAVYMQGMAAAGAASYMDCIGVHYNEGIIPPSQESGDPRSEHYTRYFWGMLNSYYNAFGGSRPVCFTELGYLTGEGYGALPGSFSWAGNVTVAQQAQWLAQAASLAANSGKVRMLIVWNVDSQTWGSDPQAGYAIVRPGGSCPACETLHQVMGQ
jgi:hypothetical protein